MKRIFLVLIALSTATNALPATQTFLDPVEQTVKDLENRLGIEEDPAYTACWFWNCGTPKAVMGTIEKTTNAFKEKIAELNKSLQNYKQHNVPTAPIEQQIQEYNKVIDCLQQNRPAGIDAQDFLLKNKAALQNIEKNGPKSEKDFMLLNIANNLLLRDNHELENCLNTINPKIIDATRLQPARQLVNNVAALKNQRDAISKAQLEFDKEQARIKQEAIDRKTFEEQEKVLAQARAIENTRKLKQEQATAAEKAKQDELLKKAEEIEYVRKIEQEEAAAKKLAEEQELLERAKTLKTQEERQKEAEKAKQESILKDAEKIKQDREAQLSQETAAQKATNDEILRKAEAIKAELEKEQRKQEVLKKIEELEKELASEESQKTFIETFSDKLPAWESCAKWTPAALSVAIAAVGYVLYTKIKAGVTNKLKKTKAKKFAYPKKPIFVTTEPIIKPEHEAAAAA
ncbi:hypothetical protein K2W90_03345 [Candidatus Babeliales bacterium]|nr:hypothetical protein [Candidatus Babeliales bacterium]